MDDVHDEGVSDFPDAILFYKDFEIVGVTWIHWVTAEVVDEALDALIAPDDGCGGRCEMEIEDFDGYSGLACTVSGPRQ